MKFSAKVFFYSAFFLQFISLWAEDQPFDFQENTIQVPSSLVDKKFWINDFDARLLLARDYSYLKKRQREALEQYKKLLKIEPENKVLLIEAGRVSIALKKFNLALSFLYKALDQASSDPDALLAASQAEIGLGHAQRSKSLMQRLLQIYCVTKIPDDKLISSADLMMGWGDFIQAENIYKEALYRSPNDINLWLKYGGVLYASQRYEEAKKLYNELICAYPKDRVKILKAIIQVNITEKDFDSALMNTEQLLAIASKPVFFRLKADILYLSGCYDRALKIYLWLSSIQKNPQSSLIGAGKSYLKLHEYSQAEKIFNSVLRINSKNLKAKYYLTKISCQDPLLLLSKNSSIQSMQLLALLSLESGDSNTAREIYSLMIEKDSEYFSAYLGLAEMLSINFDFQGALSIYTSLLDSFPEDSKLMLSMARVISWSKEYETALNWYDALIARNYYNPVFWREKARVAIWGKMYDLSMDTYDHLLSSEYNDLPELQRSVYLEKEEKDLVWNKKFREALPTFGALMAEFPGNQEALFDYAQDYCDIGRCDCSKKMYNYILENNPNHNLVKLALERNIIRTNPLVGAGLLYWREIGSGSFSQSQIARYQLDLMVEQPLTCKTKLRFFQRQWVENPFYNFKFYPAEGQTIEGETIYNNYIGGSASATYKNYFGKFKSRITGHIQAYIYAHDACRLTFRLARENEVCNYFSMKQAIQYTACTFNLASNINKWWSLEGTYWHLDYNDRNTLQRVNLITEYAFTDTPHIFKLILAGNYYNTRHQTITFTEGTKVIDVIHPYWTPKHYFSGYLTFQYRYDYRFFEFCEAPERYLDIKIIGGDDNVNNPSIELSFAWKHEFERHWGIELKGLIHRSPLWNAEGGWATLTYRF